MRWSVYQKINSPVEKYRGYPLGHGFGRLCGGAAGGGESDLSAVEIALAVVAVDDADDVRVGDASDEVRDGSPAWRGRAGFLGRPL